MKTDLEALARLVDGKITGDSHKAIAGAAAFDDAGPDEITCAFRPDFLKRIESTQAGAVIVPRPVPARGQNLMVVGNPQLAFISIVNHLHPPRDPGIGVDARAVIGKAVQWGEDFFAGPGVVIGAGVQCGHRVKIQAGTVIGPEVVIGDDVTIFSNVTIAEGCRIGNRVTIFPGTVIGSDGFGYAPDGERYVKIPHTGIVRIDDDVEIGANNAIDRGTFGQTWLKRGVKTDNLVHIAHNVVVGEDTLLVAQVGISGSSVLGRHVIMAGQAGMSGHLHVGDHVIIGPQAGIAKSIPDGRTVSGSPEMPHRLWLRVTRLVPRLPDLFKRLSRLEKQVTEIKNADTGRTQAGGER